MSKPRLHKTTCAIFAPAPGSCSCRLPSAQPFTTSDPQGFITNVPYQHDRIVWRGKYYHLIEGHIPQVVSAQAEPQVKLEPEKPNAAFERALGACTDSPPTREGGGNTRAPSTSFFMYLYITFLLGALTFAVTAPLFLHLFTLFP